ncbi:hypothetical protein B0H14DRAFT_3727302 [Mycena olivaceomarginata]|nr:hypothetical protein B0H14DRAFT_3727302 [Mycena olivaceomarginata]
MSPRIRWCIQQLPSHTSPCPPSLPSTGKNPPQTPRLQPTRTPHPHLPRLAQLTLRLATARSTHRLSSAAGSLSRIGVTLRSAVRANPHSTTRMNTRNAQRRNVARPRRCPRHTPHPMAPRHIEDINARHALAATASQRRRPGHNSRRVWPAAARVPGCGELEALLTRMEGACPQTQSVWHQRGIENGNQYIPRTLKEQLGLCRTCGKAQRVTLTECSGQSSRVQQPSSGGSKRKVFGRTSNGIRVDASRRVPNASPSCRPRFARDSALNRILRREPTGGKFQDGLSGRWRGCQRQNPACSVRDERKKTEM